MTLFFVDNAGNNFLIRTAICGNGLSGGKTNQLIIIVSGSYPVYIAYLIY